MLKDLTLFPILLVLTACVSNTFEKNFVSSSVDETGLAIMPTADMVPNLIESDDIENDLNKMLEQKYIVLGVNEFEDEMKSRRSAIEFAKKIGASHVLFNREFVEKRYKRPTYAAKRETSQGSILARFPAGVTNFKKYEKIKIFSYSVAYLRSRSK